MLNRAPKASFHLSCLLTTLSIFFPIKHGWVAFQGFTVCIASAWVDDLLLVSKGEVPTPCPWAPHS